MTQEFKVKCPCCDKYLKIKLDNNKLIVDSNQSLINDTELSQKLSELNIEFG